jgi:hypothetical protein
MLFLERGSVFVLTGKEKRFWNPYRVIWIRYNRGRPLEDFDYRKQNSRNSNKIGLLIP